MQLPDLNLGSAGLFALIGASLTAVVSMWGQVRGLFKQLSSLLILQTIVHEDGNLYRVVSRYCRTECKRLPSGILNYKGMHTKLSDRSFRTVVPFLVPRNVAFIYCRLTLTR